jgi:putative ABC transport system permease protein
MAIWLDKFRQDIRHAWRVCAKAPGFTAIAVLSIACGTGANVAIFSVADVLLLRPPPVPRPSELIVLGSRVDQGQITQTLASYPDYLDVRDHTRSFDGVVAYVIRRNAVRTPGATTQVKPVRLVSGNFFEVLRVEPIVGRTFRADEDRVLGRDAVAILSYGLWQQQYGADPDVVGRQIRVGGVDFTIVGVAPAEFTGLERREFPQTVYIPLAMAPAIGDKQIAGLHAERGTRMLTVRARLRPGMSLTQARADVTSLSDNLERAYPDTNRRQSLIVQTDLESIISTDTADAGLVVMLSILSLSVLAVACANVAGLLASRAPIRAREIALRLAVGADRSRLVRQLITESVMLAAAGGACGLVFGYAGIVLIRGGNFFPSDLIQIPAMTLDQRVFAFNLIVAMTSAFVFGLGPAWHMTRVDLAVAMKTGDQGTQRPQRLSGRSMLVTLQVALSLVVTLATLTVQEFRRVTVDGPGFRTSHLAKVTVDTDPRRYDLTQSAQFFERAVDATRRLPSVVSASAASYFPLWGLDLPTFEAQTIETFYESRGIGFLRTATELIGALGMMGMLLTMVGLYGLVSYSVSRRTREIGIRIAIGATSARVLNMILRQGMQPAWLGLPIGLVLSVATTRMMPIVLPTTDRTDVRLFLIAAPLLFAVVLLAAFVPARRAAKVDPTIALRCE